MDKDGKFHFWPNLEVGFTRGIGTLLAYGVAFLLLSLLIKPQTQAAQDGQQPDNVITMQGLTGRSCSNPWA
jgi:hypothetical protein